MGGTGTTNCGLALVWHQRRRFLCVFSPNHRTHPHKRFPGKRPFIAFFREGRAPSRPIFYPLLPGWEKEVGRHGGRPSLNFSRFLAGNSVHVAPKKGAPVLDTRTRPLELEFRVGWNGCLRIALRSTEVFGILRLCRKCPDHTHIEFEFEDETEEKQNRNIYDLCYNHSNGANI